MNTIKENESTSYTNLEHILKILVDKKLDEGLTEDQIYEYFRTKYGEWILYDPELNKNTFILWLLPILIFLFGGAIIYKNFIVKK